jgi:hypothetical protein
MYQEVAVTQGLTEPCPTGDCTSHIFPTVLPTTRKVREQLLGAGSNGYLNGLAQP